MDIEPYTRVNGLAFGSSESTVVLALGTPTRSRKSRIGWMELIYDKLVARLSEGQLVEMTADAPATNVAGELVHFADLARFLKQKDDAAFEQVGFVVSPKYGIAFDPAFPSWVTAFQRGNLPHWRQPRS